MKTDLHRHTEPNGSGPASPQAIPGGTRASRQIRACICVALLAAFLPLTLHAGELIVDDLHVIAAGNVYGTMEIGPGVMPTNAHVLRYSFNTNGGAGVTDQSPEGNDGSVSGATYSTNGHDGGAYTFDGNDLISVPDDDSLEIIDGEITITAWMKSTYSGSHPAYAVNKMNPGHPYEGYALFMEGSGQNHVMAFNVNDNHPSDIRSYCPGTTTLNDGEWHHVAGVMDRTAELLYVYVDGVCEATDDISDFTDDVNSGSLALSIGKRGNDYYTGAIDDVRIYDSALSAPQIKSSYLNSLANYGLTNASLSVDCAADFSGQTTIKYLVPQGDIEMGSFTNQAP